MKPDQFKTPGQYIKSLLHERGWTQRVLAIVLGVHEAGLNMVIAGKRPLDAQLALTLSEVFDVSPDALLSLQKSYELAKARIVAIPDPSRFVRAQLYGNLPVVEMIKRGWLEAEDIRVTAQVESSLVKFFGVESVDEIEILPHAAKKTKISVNVTAAQLAWIYRVKQIAAEMLVAPYSPRKVRGSVSKLRDLLVSPEAAGKVPRILTESGIRFVIVEALSSSKIDGVCFWLDDFSPVIGLTLRFDRIDNFWFVLRHELEHVIQRHGRSAAMLDVELEGDRAGTGDDIAEEERVANDAASSFCVPREKLDRFIARKSPFLTERDILGFSRTVGVHPGLVAGQLQHRTKRYDRFRKHLAKVRAIVRPNAFVDGWGDVAPVDL